MITQSLETSVHGRYLFMDRGPERLLVGFHGYAETAETLLAEVEQIPGIDRWSVVSIQALHPFYTRSGSIVASWMTSLDRELAIADNTRYVKGVLATLAVPQGLVFLGFSQGATLAARAAAAFPQASGLVMLGGDLPSEIHDDPTVALPPVLIGRGERDEWYTEEKLNKDLSFLEGKQVETFLFPGGHEWTDEFRGAAGQFLGRL